MDPPCVASNGNSNTATESPLCAICSAQLALDDADSGGALKNENGVSVLYFPYAESLRSSRHNSLEIEESVNTWKGGVVYERTVTPPNLPELSDSFPCKFCLTLKRSLLDRYGDWLCHPEMENTYDQTAPDKFPVMAEPGRCRDWLHIEQTPIERSPSGKVLRLTKEWIKKCDSNTECAEHRKFSQNKVNFLPTRLLYLGDGTTGQCPQIVEARDFLEIRSEIGRQHTLSKYKLGLPEHKIPQLFQDAIAVSRGIGIQYLWVDALCILQDVREDWEREAFMMSDIFYHSFITIGAATARSCHDSILDPREDLSCTLGFQSSLLKEVVGSYCIYLSKMSHKRPSDTDLSNSIWTNRGWVWQEQIMTQRLLVFGRKMVHLKCHGCIYSENGTVSNVFTSYILRASKFHTTDMLTGDWEKWMNDFSGRQFTFPSDKLASVSGLALAFERVLATRGQPPEYLAGHWQDERFHISLQWTVTPENKVPFRNMIKDLYDPEKYCAPSWSWASRNQGRLIMLPIGNDPKGTKADFEFISNNLVAAKSNVRVKTSPGSSITLRGRVRPFVYPPTESTRRYDRLRYIPRSAEWEVSVPGGKIYYFLDWNPLLDDTSWEKLRPSLRLFLLTHIGMGLVLLSESNYEPGFRRVGVFLFVSSNRGMNGSSWSQHGFIFDNLESDFLQTGWNVEIVVLY
ncbi:uncharacterized protein EAE97_002642 [Botrytis byssoidea]|uniref:Heterokaryon incompatibility domain-containing protein n=1 Tax=Botrytis byssoidea TaxID=139641 RepID=A0A9P5ITX7_9HELO|nr:uncharacterized protein EAE97_002642 [Botrytis byssoidea]KAF7951091.1 hypothetical protein EAE97_002642 [Botrytis byssoidea]